MLKSGSNWQLSLCYSRFQSYGSLGELAILVLPQSQITSLIRKFELAGNSTDSSAMDLMAAIKDPNVKEIVAKESLQYRSKASMDPEQEAKNVKALENLLEVS